MEHKYVMIANEKTIQQQIYVYVYKLYKPTSMSEKYKRFCIRMIN